MNKDISQIIDKINIQSHILSLCYEKPFKSKYKDELFWTLFEAEEKIKEAIQIANMEKTK